MRFGISAGVVSVLTTFMCLVLSSVATSEEPPLDEVRTLLRTGDTAAALRQLDQLVAEQPADLETRWLRAQVFIRQRNHAAAVADLDIVVRQQPTATAYQLRGTEHFKLGEIDNSIADFDAFLKLRPDQEPHHWQRGISYYYAGRFDDGRRQFELHRTVNPQDVENSVWHFLCVARATGVEAARKQLLPIERDGRVPMMEVYALFAGRGTADDVLRAAQADSPQPTVLSDQLFYAHLYLGLYSEALGDPAATREHILLAAEKYPSDHYMGDVARVHAARLRAAR